MAMPDPATGMTPLEYMACADQELAAGHHRKAAALLWKATEATFLGLARERGLDHSNPRPHQRSQSPGSRRLDVPKFHYRSGLVVGKLMRDHAEMDLLEDCKLEDAYKATRKFIVECFGEPE